MENSVLETKTAAAAAESGTELRCPSCHKLLLKGGEIKCPRCKDLVALHSCLIDLDQDNLYIINTANMAGRQIKELIAKWPAALQQEFAYALQLMSQREVHQEELKVKLVTKDKAEEQGKKAAAEGGTTTTMRGLAEALLRVGIKAETQDLKADPQFRRIALEVLLLFAGRSRPNGGEIELRDICAFCSEPAKSGSAQEDLAKNALEAYLMAYWQHNPRAFDYLCEGKKVWEYVSPEAQRDAIIFLTKNYKETMQEKILV